MVDYLGEGRTVNGVYYVEELRRLCQEIMEERRGNLTRGVLLLQDNGAAHTSQVATAAASRFFLIHHSSFSRFSPLDFYLFPNLKNNLCDRNFGSCS